eukprot:6201712-Pleurochrysis_carterae.AAC.5
MPGSALILPLDMSRFYMDVLRERARAAFAVHHISAPVRARRQGREGAKRSSGGPHSQPQKNRHARCSCMAQRNVRQRILSPQLQCCAAAKICAQSFTTSA